MTIPSVSDYLNASNYAYARNLFVPPGFKPLVDLKNGQPVISKSNDHGVYGVALVNSSGQVIIAFEGTHPNNSGSFGADVQIVRGKSPPGNAEALRFANFVVGVAKEQGYAKDDIFVTGHSLGGTYAEYVATQIPGLGGGAAFGRTGVPDYRSTAPSSAAAANFTNYLDYGDGLGTYVSDTAVGQALGMSNADHVGSIQFLGDPTGRHRLVNAAALATSPSIDLEGANLPYGLAVFGGQIGSHRLGNYAGNLNVPLQDSSVLGQPGVKDFFPFGSNMVMPIVSPSSTDGLVQHSVIDQATGASPVEVAGIPVSQAPRPDLIQSKQVSPNEVVNQQFSRIGSSGQPIWRNYNDFRDPSPTTPMFTAGPLFDMGGQRIPLPFQSGPGGLLGPPPANPTNGGAGLIAPLASTETPPQPDQAGSDWALQVPPARIQVIPQQVPATTAFDDIPLPAALRRLVPFFFP